MATTTEQNIAETVIDGSAGEGGGQILRTSLTLAMVTGRPVRIKNIRAGRAKPGLMRQHLAAVQAAQRISGAVVSGDELGSQEVCFAPQPVMAGHYEFRIGSAGSTTLLMQTLLPALALAGEPSTVTVHGGTHNGMAPSVDFCELSLLPLLARMGLQTQSTLVSHGFFPNGGGQWRLHIEPWAAPATLRLLERGGLVARQAVAKISNLETHIADRELARVAKKLRWNPKELIREEVCASGPGNMLSLRCQYRHVAETFEVPGALGVTAERVAGRAITQARAYMEGDFAVGEYLADQLLLPMVLGGGGEFSTGVLSEHCRTNMALIERFFGASLFEVTEANGRSTIRIPRGLAVTR